MSLGKTPFWRYYSFPSELCQCSAKSLLKRDDWWPQRKSKIFPKSLILLLHGMFPKKQRAYSRSKFIWIWIDMLGVHRCMCFKKIPNNCQSTKIEGTNSFCVILSAAYIPRQDQVWMYKIISFLRKCSTFPHYKANCKVLFFLGGSLLFCLSCARIQQRPRGSLPFIMTDPKALRRSLPSEWEWVKAAFMSSIYSWPLSIE